MQSWYTIEKSITSNLEEALWVARAYIKESTYSCQLLFKLLEEKQQKK